MVTKIEFLKKLLSDNQIEKVLLHLVSIFSITDSELFLDAHILASDYNRLESDIRRERGSAKEREITQNRIYASTISLIEELKANQSILATYHEKEKKLNIASVERSNIQIPDAEKDILFRRMARIKERNIDFRILWIDDEPHFQKTEIEQVEEIGVKVDIAANEEEGRGLLRNFTYQLIVSDIARPGRDKNGLDFLKELTNKEINIPFVFYISKIDRSRGTPPYAFGITNSVAELFHLIMDVIARNC